VHEFITTLRTSTQALLQLVRQRNGVQVLALDHDIKRMLGWVGISPSETG